MAADRRQQRWPGRVVPGALSWIVAAAAIVGTLVFPQQWVWVCAVYIAYFVARMAVHTVFYLAGELRCRQWERRDWSLDEHTPGRHGFAPADVHHVVVIPAYKEPMEVLTKTLDALAAQLHAKDRLMVVLGMEQAEPGGLEKGRRLAERYRSSFFSIIATEHPRNLENEVPGKSSNQTWAAREARRELDLLRVDPSRVTITSCDADSRLHPSYLAAVAHLFANAEDPHRHFWQAPLFFDNNIWDVPAPVRFSTWFVHSEHLSELAMPFYEPLPLSTYTLSMQTAEECGWWDPLVISEDWHAYLNCLFARDGDLTLEPVFLPTHGDATGGDNFVDGVVNRFNQLVRHSWGAEDVGFILSAMATRGTLKRGKGLFRLAQVTHDHVLRVASWFIITSGYLLSSHGYQSVAAVRHPSSILFTSAPDLGNLFTAGAVLLFAMVAVDLVRCPPPKGPMRYLVLFEVTLMWLGLPIIGLVLGMLPAFYAQTRLMFGQPITYKVTPRKASRTAA